MDTGGQATDEMGPGRVEEVFREPHVRYAGLLMAFFSQTAPRLVHAQGSPVKGASFGFPGYDHDTGSLVIDQFHQTGFGVVPGRQSFQVQQKLT